MMNINQFRADHLIKLLLSFLLYIKDYLTHTFHNSPFLSLSSLIFIITSVALLYTLRKLWNIIKQLQQHSVFLELTPPAFTDKTSYTTQQLFSVLHHLGSQRTFFERLLGK